MFKIALFNYKDCRMPNLILIWQLQIIQNHWLWKEKLLGSTKLQSQVHFGF